MVVSVVIPSYNHVNYVGQAIESVLDQTFSEIDLIVIDDGSTDGSVEIIRELHGRRGGFRFVSRENRGLIKTLNEGLGLARGEYFCELASDDYFPPDSLEVRVEYLNKNPRCVAVFGDGILVAGNTQTQTRIMDDRRRAIFEKTDPIPDMLRGALPVLSTSLMSREVLQSIGGFDEKAFRYYEDLDVPIKLALEGRLDYMDHPVIYRRAHDTNVSSSTNHIRAEKVLCYTNLSYNPRLSPYKAILRRRIRRSFLALGRHIDKNSGGNDLERRVFGRGWTYSWQDLRLLYYLIKWARHA